MHHLKLNALFLCALGAALIPRIGIADCSAYRGKVLINEVLTTKTDTVDPFVELFVAEPVDIASGWTVTVQGNRGNVKGASQAVPSAFYPAQSYIILTFSGGELKTPGNDVLLQDAAGNDVDFLRFGGTGEALSPSCDALDTTRVEYEANDRQVCSLPDGHPEDSEDWAATRCSVTPGGSNLPVGGVCALSGFALSPSATALACPETRAEVSIRALCSDGSTKTDYRGSVELASDRPGTLFFETAGSSETVSSYTFTAGSGGLASLYYYYPDEAAVAVTVTDGETGVVATGAPTEFRAFGFVTDVPAGAQASCAVTPSRSPLYTLTAFGRLKDSPGCGVIEGFDGVKNLKIWSEYLLPAANPFATRVRVNGVPVATEEADRYGVTFVGGRAAFDLAYPDAGRIRVHFKHDEDPYDGDPFAAMAAQTPAIDMVPAGFGITASTAAGSLQGNDHSAVEMAPAGVPFSLRIQAQCSDGTVTPNYRPASARLALAQVLPEPGVLSLAGTDHAVNGAPVPLNALFSAGAVEDAMARYSEVGVLGLTVADPDYPGGAIGPSTAPVGRFHPHHFELAVNDTGALTSECNAFVYTGQQTADGEGALGYERPPVLRIIPRNVQGELTANYVGDYVKLQPEDVLIEEPVADSVQRGADGTTALAVSAVLGTGSLVEVLEEGRTGYLDYIFSADDHFRYLRGSNSRIAPFSARLGLTVREVRDRNGDLDVGNDVLASGPLPTLTPAGLTVRYGRLQLENAFGPETENLPVPLQAQFFDGSRFVRNSLDSCTNYSMSNASLEHGPYPDDNLQEGETGLVAPAAETTLLAGAAPAAGLPTLQAPGLGNEGQVALILDVASWLEYDWDGTGDRDPHSEVTFGRYRGHDRVIYWQEPLGR